MVDRRANYIEILYGLTECEITQSGIAACSHILSCCGCLHVVVSWKEP